MRYHRILLVAIVLILASCSSTEPMLKIGLVADPQYANKPTVGKRYYAESLWKLKQAIDTFNTEQVDFVQNLGDIIDDDWSNYDSIIPVYEHLNQGIPNYHLLGNHDFSIDSTHFEELLTILSMPDYYYSYQEKGWRFIVLDATDYSFYSNQLHKHDTNQVNAYYHHTKEKPNHKIWNSAMGEEQQNWLKQELAEANTMHQKVILFSHMPLRPAGDPHNLWNNDEIIAIMESSPDVVAFINGHNHAGAYVFKNGIHYITIFGMVDTMIGSFGILEVYQDSLVLRGFGNQQTLRLRTK